MPISVVAPGDPDPHHHSARAARPLIATRLSSVKRDCGIGRGDVRARLKERESRRTHGIRKRLIVVAAWYPAAHHPVARPVLALITDVGAVAHIRETRRGTTGG